MGMIHSFNDSLGMIHCSESVNEEVYKLSIFQTNYFRVGNFSEDIIGEWELVISEQKIIVMRE